MTAESRILSKRTAILLTIFLGLFGIHRLYLGKTLTGRIMMGLGIAACSITGTVAAVRVDPIGLIAPAVFAVLLFIALAVWSVVDLILIATDKMPDGFHLR